MTYCKFEKIQGGENPMKVKRILVTIQVEVDIKSVGIDNYQLSDEEMLIEAQLNAVAWFKDEGPADTFVSAKNGSIKSEIIKDL